jgi:Uma2 family endonuclease
MSTYRTEPLLTVEDLYNLPDDGTTHELQAGLLVREPAPGHRHGRVAAHLTALLDTFVRARRLGVVASNDTGYILGRSPDTTRAPDVSFVSRERFDSVGDLTTVFPGPPDLAVEVLSPSNTPTGIHAKVADYLAAGAPLVWVVDSEHERVVVYRSLLSPRTLGSSEKLSGEEVIPGFEVEVSAIFEI